MAEVDPVWISEAEVVSLIDLGEAIQVVERALQAEHAGSAENLLKSHLTWARGSLHAIGGTLLSEGVVGTKSWAHTLGGAAPLLVLYDAADGGLLAAVEAFALGQYRTAAMSGAATHALARSDATRLAVLGTGRQALIQAAAVAAVRPIGDVRVWGRAADRRAAFAQRVQDALGVPAAAADSVTDAVDGSHVVTLVTRATEPFLPADAVSRGAHVNAVGAITRERAEFDPKLLARCDLVVADSVPQARALSRELGDYYGTDDAAWAAVRPLAEFAGDRVRRPDGADVTLFKALGVGLADVALGSFVYRQALENRVGTPLSRPQRSRPRLRSSLQRPGVGYV